MDIGEELRALADDARTGVAFLTRIPMPHPEGPRPHNLARAQRIFPLVAAVIGLIIGLAYDLLLSLGVPPVAAAAISLGVGMLLTGGLHEDGLADLADGFGGGRDKQAKLEIMRDSRLGTYGALALLVSFAAKASSVAALPGAAAIVALITAHALSRAIIPIMSLTLKPARADGLAASAEKPDFQIALTAAGLGLVIGLFAIGWRDTAIAALIAAACAAAVSWLAARQIGGVTGDVYGAAEQVAETAIIVALAARLS